jgi:hypothetical protein
VGSLGRTDGPRRAGTQAARRHLTRQRRLLVWRRHALGKLAGRDIGCGPGNYYQSRYDRKHANDDRRAARFGHFHSADHHWTDGRMDARCALVTETARKGDPPAAPTADAEQFRVAVVTRMPDATGDPHGAQGPQSTWPGVAREDGIMSPVSFLGSKHDGDDAECFQALSLRPLPHDLLRPTRQRCVLFMAVGMSKHNRRTGQ